MESNKGVFSPVVRWWLSFSVMAVALVTALLGGLGKFIVASDQTYLSWVVIFIFMSVSMHIGYRVTKKGSDDEFGVANKSVGLCTAFGLLGTIIGLILAITGAFADVDVSSHESLKDALTSISMGVGSALVTTLIGIVCAIGLQLQLMVVKESWGVK